VHGMVMRLLKCEVRRHFYRIASRNTGCSTSIPQDFKVWYAEYRTP
jgi:hypothetical protein